MTKIRVLLVASLGLSAPLATAATPPGRINFQGVLRSSANAPLTGTFDVVFRLYDASAGGNEILVDAHTASGGNAVTVAGGLLNTHLGGGTVSDGSGPGVYPDLASVFRDYGTVYVAIHVGAETLTPRIQVVAAAHALNSAYANDADFLDGISSSGFAPSAHTHPGTDITSPVASANAAPWSGLTGVPAGFADGIDNDTTYQAGTGLGLNGNVFEVVAPPFKPFSVVSHAITKVSVSQLGLAVGVDGLPLLVLTSSDGIETIHCNDLGCGSVVRTTHDPALFHGAALTIGGDGMGLYSYVRSSSDIVEVRRCADVPCTSSTAASTGIQSPRTAITTGPNGFGIVVLDTNVRILSCTNGGCSTFTSFDRGSGSGASVTMGPKGYPVLAFINASGLVVDVCTSVTCSTRLTATLAGSFLTSTAVDVDRDGRPIVATVLSSNPTIATCSSANCGSLSSTTFNVGSASGSIAMAISSDGSPLFLADAVNFPSPKTLFTIHGTISAPRSSTTTSNLNPAVAVGGDDFPIVAWVDSALNIMHCSDPACIPYFRSR